MELTYRPRRLRRTTALRAMVREHQLRPADFIYPLFVHEGATNEPISAMPGAQRWSLEGLVQEVGRAWELGIRCVVLFPKVADGLKTEDGAECFNEGGLIPRAIRRIKAAHPGMTIMTDVALDPYSCDGHDGIVSADGIVLNDETVEILCRQAVAQAKAGADLIGPSDMMDGRVGAIREALDEEGFEHVGIISYTAKYASAYYGPFREALDSAPRAQAGKPIPKDKSTYQMDPANGDEVVRMIVETTGSSAEIARQTLQLYFDPDRGVIPKQAEIDVRGFAQVIQTMGEVGELKAPLPPVERFMDLQYLKAAGLQ
jgi:porphobilinogen synthase